MHKNTGRFYFSLLVAGALACTPPGPLERELIALEKRAIALNAKDTVERSEQMELVKAALPLIDQKSFTQARDVEVRDEIMYRASLLGAAALVRLGNMKSARELYMNAYLLNEKAALTDMGEKLPEGVPLTTFEEVRVPEYTVEKTDSLGPGEYRVAIRVQEELPYFLIQMVCGAVLRELKAAPETKAVRLLEMKINNSAGAAATGRWDLESDQIVVKLPAGK